MPLLEQLGRTHAGYGFASRFDESASANYFQPASIPLHESAWRLSIESWWTNHKINKMHRPKGFDVPQNIFEARITDDGQLFPLPNRPLPTGQINEVSDFSSKQRYSFLNLSYSTPISPERLSFGMTVVMPTESFQKQEPHFVDERAQYFGNELQFERLDGRFGNFGFSAAMNLKIVDELCVGAGINLTTTSRATPTVYIPDAAAPNDSITMSNVEVSSRIVPHFGVMARFSTKTSLGASIHFPFKSTVDGESFLGFWDENNTSENEDSVNFEFAHDHLPLRITLGIVQEVDFFSLPFSISAIGQYTQWSKYIDTVGESPKGFSDTLDPELRLAYQGDNEIIALSGRYQFSMISPQNGRTNYVDNEQIAAELSYRIKPKSLPVSIGLSVQSYVLLARSHYKNISADIPIIDELPDAVSVTDQAPLNESKGLQTNNPGFPGYESSGSGFIIGLSIGS